MPGYARRTGFSGLRGPALCRFRGLRACSGISAPARPEIYLHPATRDEFIGSAPGYHYADELAALLDPDVCALARHPNVTLAGYGDC